MSHGCSSEPATGSTLLPRRWRSSSRPCPTSTSRSRRGPRTGILEAAWAINDRAYGDAAGTWAGALGELPPEAGHLYLAHVANEPASFVLMHDHDDDCGFWFAATVPEARGRGLVTGLLRRALLYARERGCTTSTTQATAMGRGIYRRLGYRDLGPLELWERRR
jgi:GNAT superfamily N-acetyltransferase